MATNDRPVTQGYLAQVLDGIAAKMGEFFRSKITDALAPVDGKLAGVEARVKAMEERPQMRYAGIYREGLDYEPGAVATHSGQLWHAWTRTSDRPGSTDAWQLMFKRDR